MKYNKVFPTLAIALVLALLVATVPAAPILAQYFELTQTQRKIGERVDIYGSQLNLTAQVTIYFSDEPANIGGRIDTNVLNYEKVVTTTYTTAIGELFAYFLVPSKLTDGDDPDTKVRSGIHYVYLTYFGLKQIVAFDTFIVESTGMITTLDPEKGVVGIEVEITGEGFDAREDIIVEYDGDEVAIESGDDRTDSSGDFETTTIIIPPSTAGDHTIAVIGEDSEIEASAEFTVEPKITVTPASGTTGDTVTVNGSGFGDRVDFSIFFDDDEVVADEETNRKGSFEVTFKVPSLAPGIYDLEVEDDDDNSNKAEFTIATSTISLSPTSGYAGSEVTVSGTGFKASNSITITFDNENLPAVSTDAQGKFTATFTVPVRTTGTYTVKVSDGTNTVTANFSIGTSATISPTTSTAAPGHVGTEVTISGVGFTAGGTVTVTYDGTQVKTAIVGTNGDFSAIFNAPAGSGGQYAIIATDGTNRQQFTFFMESTLPPTPAPLKPEMGIKAKAEAYFDWEEVTDPSGVTYTLQIATDENFSTDSIVLEQTGTTQSEYTITKEERLKSVSKDVPYYWRVRAIDGAFNESEWSGTGSFYVGFTFGLSQATIYTFLGIGTLLLFIFGFWLGRKTAYF